MTEENKKLLLQELCTRLPYGVKVAYEETPRLLTVDDIGNCFLPIYGIIADEIERYQLYLRPIESITKQEEKELEKTIQYTQYTLESYDWLNAHHFDYRWGYDEKHDMWRPLIELGLALPAPEGMYNN